MPQLIVETSEGLTLRHELAGGGSRFAAGLFDVVLSGIAYAVVVFAAAMITEAANVGRIVPGLMIGGWPLVLLAYRFGFHLAWQGQTPGKRITGLRVTSGDGYPATAMQLALRALLLPVDVAPLPLFVGLVVIQLTPRRQRLGDLVANTVVLRETGAAAHAEPFADETWSGLETKSLALTPGLAARFDAQDFEFLRDLWTREGLRYEGRRRLFVSAARHYAQRLELASFDDARTLLKELYLFLRESRTVHGA